VSLGPGPVFAYEWLTMTRRWQLYAMRTGFVGVILIGMIFIWQASNPSTNPRQTVSIQMLASYGENLYKTIVSIELTLVLLAAPAATAGAICLDKTRGTLDHLLATDLTSAEIVLGKIGVRLVPVLGLIACVLPIAALTSLLGGIDPTALLGSFLTAIACAALGCSLALTLSVWGRKTHEVLMLTYLILILWSIGPLLVEIVRDIFGTSVLAPTSAPSVLEWIVHSNPYYLVFAPYTNPGKVGLLTYLMFLGLCLVLSALLLAVATRRIRGVALTQAGRPAASVRHTGFFSRHFPNLSWPRFLPGPSLDGNPILWREWHRSKPSRLLRVVWILYSALGLFWIVAAFQVVTMSRGNQETIAIMSMFQVGVGLLLLSVSAATGLADERIRGSLDVLLCTPLSTQSILTGKWWGSFRQAISVLIWPAILGGFLVAQSGHYISYVLLLGLVTANCAVITSLGLAIATWVRRLGHAVALCVSAYAVFSIGWVMVVFMLGFAARLNHEFHVPMIMWSPPCGIVFATMAVVPGELPISGVGAYAIGFGASFWMMVDALIALAIFLTTLATFDHCLGRVTDTAGCPMPDKKHFAGVDTDLDEWFAESTAELSGPVRQGSRNDQHSDFTSRPLPVGNLRPGRKPLRESSRGP
jgi:ABC-type transport system involved in multi-copper enzyme maturation permease subunit